MTRISRPRIFVINRFSSSFSSDDVWTCHSRDASSLSAIDAFGRSLIFLRSSRRVASFSRDVSRSMSRVCLSARTVSFKPSRVLRRSCSSSLTLWSLVLESLTWSRLFDCSILNCCRSSSSLSISLTSLDLAVPGITGLYGKVD